MIDLSIAIVSWNTRSILADCLRSVAGGLDHLAAEVFVVDNGSTDGSPAMVRREFPEVRLLRNHVNRGFAAATNQALRAARGRYALLLNSDTVVLGTVLPDSVRYLDRHPDVGALGCGVLNPDRSPQQTCVEYPHLRYLLRWMAGLDRLRPNRGGPLRTALDVDTVAGCFLMARRSAIEQIGLLDERFFFYGEDADWCARLRGAGWRVRRAPTGEIIHVGGASTARLDERRERLLDEALIDLHRKHRGEASAAAAGAILLGRHLVRAAAWGIAAALPGTALARRRAAGHWRTVCATLAPPPPPGADTGHSLAAPTRPG